MRARFGLWARVLLLAAIVVCPTVFLPGGAQAGPPDDARLHIDLRLAEPHADLSHLTALGLEIELALPDLGRVQGWIAASKLPALRAAAGVREVAAPHYALFASGSTISEGDEALGAADARARFGVDGSGVRVAIISDGIRGLAEAQERGDAPQLAEALAFGAGWLERGAEGTAMLELVHDLAPGAQLSFGAVATDTDTIAAVRYFAQRVDVIVDDVGFLYPDDQQSDVSRNTAAALAHPDWPLRAYITAAGNWAQTHWSGRFSAGVDGAALGLPNPGPLHTWRQGAPLNRFRLERGERVVVALHWDEPWGRAEHDFDLYLLDQSGAVVASSERRQAIDALNPQELLVYTNEAADARFGLVVQNWRAAADPLELELFVLHRSGETAASALETATGESSLLAQADAGGGVITVAAIAHDQDGLNRTAQYSSQGPTNNGAAKPDIAAVDGVRISGATEFGARFFGTSAAAPHVAAVAALLLEAQPALLAANGGSAAVERRLLRELLLETAIDIGPEGHDTRSGAGRINAEAALAAARERLITVASAADRGEYTLRDAITRVNAGEADYIAFDNGITPRVITLESPLPPLERDGAVLDGAGWRLDAHSTAAGLVLAGAGITLAGLEIVGAADAGVVVSGNDAQALRLRLAQNGRGLVIGAADAALEQIVAVGNRGPGIVVETDGSGRLTHSRIGIERDGTPNGNGGPGVQLEAGAGRLIVGAEHAPPPDLQNAPPPIAPLALTELEPRAGALHLLRGVLLIDGLPAAPGAALDLWLDRRSAGRIEIGSDARFEAAIAGPGVTIRFSLNGAPLETQLRFQSGASSRLLLRATAAAATSAELTDGNQIAFNAGPTLSQAADAAAPTVRGNRIWSNGGAWIATADEQTAAPRILELEFAQGLAALRGAAPGAASVDLYAASSDAAAQYLAGAPVQNGSFAFERIDVGTADRFWVLAHDAQGGALGVSAGRAAAPAPQIRSLSPRIGGYPGGELLTIVGARFRIDGAPPRVFIGGVEALVRSADSETIIVETPAAAWQGATDLTVLRSDGRAAQLRDAWRYDDLRRVSLQPGWNTVTWQGLPTRITAALTPIARQALRAYAWDAANQRWLGFAPELPATLNTLQRLPTGAILWLLIDAEQPVIWLQPLPPPP